MKAHPILSKTIAAMASLAILTTAAHAASLVNTTDGAGELFIGVHATGGVGNGKSVVIDVGAVSALSALTAGSTLSLGSIGTDLAAQFGGTWYNRTDLLWSAVAGVQSAVPITSADPTSTIYGSAASNGLFPLTTTAYNRSTNSTQNSVAGRILASMATGTGGFTEAAQGAASNIAIMDASDANSYASWMANGANATGLGNTPFGGFGNPTAANFEQAFDAGTLASGYEGALDVYRMYRSNTPDSDASPATGLTAGSYQFTLTIDGGGNLGAEVLPVPEPASVGMLTSLALLGVGTLRRKRAAAKA
jgi:hypothetical protein